MTATRTASELISAEQREREWILHILKPMAGAPVWIGQLGHTGSGLMNQMSHVMAYVMGAAAYGVRIVVLGGVRTDYGSDADARTVSLGDILDLPKFNAALAGLGVNVWVLDVNDTEGACVAGTAGAAVFSFIGGVEGFEYGLYSRVFAALPFHEKWGEATAGIVGKSERWNVLHLRLEDDAVAHWSARNGLTPAAFRERMEDAYLALIRAHFAADVPVLVLGWTGMEGNRVLAELGARAVRLPKLPELGREMNALMDLVAAQQCCTNVFVGNWNVHTLRGSTFDFYLYNWLRAWRPTVACCLVDVEQLPLLHNGKLI